MTALFDGNGTAERSRRPAAVSVTSGVVRNNVDALVKGKVLVRVPALDREVWARLAAPCAGPGSGFFFLPGVGAEVLVALAGDDATDAFVVGALWNERDPVPVDDPISALTTRVLRSGVVEGVGHQIEMDDRAQSLTITTSTDQKITMDPGKIELSNAAGSLSITLDNATQSVSINAANGISLEATRISLTGTTVEINGSASTTVGSSGTCSVTAPLVRLN